MFQDNITRDQALAFLPDAIRTALVSYQAFCQRDIGEDAKSFKEHHMACKVAVAHIELLLKLARWVNQAESQPQNGNDHVILGAMMREAEERLAEYRAVYPVSEPESEDTEDY